MDNFSGRDGSFPGLGFARSFTYIIICLERLWRLALPFVLIACLFFTCIWSGLFALLPMMVHSGLLVLFAASGFGTLLFLLKLRLPQHDEIDRAIERANGFICQPITAQRDTITHSKEATSPSPTSLILWREHQRRMKEKLRHIRLPSPVANIPAYDPHGLRGIIFLSVAVAFAYSFSPNSGKFSDIFGMDGRGSPLLMRVDAWVVPPDYTGHAPIYLKTANDDADTSLDVPQGSIVHIQLSSASHKAQLAIIRPHDANQVAEIAKLESAPNEADITQNITNYKLQLVEDMQLILTASDYEKSWHFTILNDLAPQISWLDEPRRAINAMLELHYDIEDDYGATKAWALITPLAEDTTIDTAHMLYDASKIMLTLPPKGLGQARTATNFATHPWAGSLVRLQLFAEDGGAHIATSEEKILTLPRLSFSNPLARAIIEQRRLLALDSSQRGRVLDMLSALLLRPQDTLNNAADTIILQSVWSRLQQAKDDKNLRDVVDYMWEIALRFEGDDLTHTQQRLKQANQALRNALRDGANTDEIERLMRDLEKAMQDYIAALAVHNFAPLTPDIAQQHLTQNDLEQQLQQIEEMAQLGNRAAAEQLLAELETIMDNLQLFHRSEEDNHATTQQQDTGQQNMNRLADLMRRQQEILNETDDLNKNWNGSVLDQDEYMHGLKMLQPRQEGLRRDIEEFAKSMAEQELEQGNEQANEQEGKSWDGVGQTMQEAQAALQEGNGEEASSFQAEALDLMRRGARDMINQMREAMRQSGQNGAGKNGAGQNGVGQNGVGQKRNGQGRGSQGYIDQNGFDPLGRGYGKNGYSNDPSHILPDKMEIEKARRILDDIRNRLGVMTPEEERAYLERLLNFN